MSIGARRMMSASGDRQGRIAYWTADFEEGPSTGTAGYSDWSFVQAEDPGQADPSNNSVVLASAEGVPSHSGLCMAKLAGTQTDNAANLYHNKLYKEWQIAAPTKVDEFGRNCQAMHPSGISGTYRAWFRVPPNFTYGGWSNIFQFKLTEQSPFAQTAQWWVAIKDKQDLGGPACSLHVARWNDANRTGGTDLDLPLNQWFEIRADVYEGVKIDWYLNDAFWQTVLNSEWGIGRGRLEVGGTPQTWVLGVGLYGGVGTLYVDDCSFTPF